MNRQLYVILIALLAASHSSCHKEEPSPTDRLVGDWQWVRSIGGMTGKQVEKPKAGDVVIERFTRDGYWTYCYNGKCLEMMPYTLQNGHSTIHNDERLILTLHRKIYLAPPDTGYHIILERYFFEQLGDSLSISQDYPDGFGETYFRKQH